MIHLPTAAGGTVEHLVRAGTVAPAGTLLARITPTDGPPEEILAPLDGIVEAQRLGGRVAARYTTVVGLRRVVLARCEGRVRWIATLGPVGLTTLIALVDHAGAILPHRAGCTGFVGERFAAPGQRVGVGAPLIEVRGEELG